MNVARVALATCAALPAGDEDADVLLAAFARAGIEASWQVWDDPGVDWTSFDVTVVRSTWDYTPRREEFLRWARDVPGLANPAALLAWSSDKVYLHDLAAAGVPTVATGIHPPGSPWPPAGAGGVGAPDRAVDTVPEPVDTVLEPVDIVLKPSVGAGSLGAGRFILPGQADAAARHVRALHEAGRTVLQQDYLAGVDTHGETAVVCLGGRVSHAARKAALLPPGTAHSLGRDLEADRHGLFVEETMAPVTPSAAELAVAWQALQVVAGRFGAPPAYARVDLLPTPGGPVVGELELVEPSLFLAYAPDPDAAADRLVAALAGPAPGTTPG